MGVNRGNPRGGCIGSGGRRASLVAYSFVEGNFGNKRILSNSDNRPEGGGGER